MSQILLALATHRQIQKREQKKTAVACKTVHAPTGNRYIHNESNHCFKAARVVYNAPQPIKNPKHLKDSIRLSITNILSNHKQDIAKLATDNVSLVENAKTTCLGRVAFSWRKVLEFAKMTISKNIYFYIIA